MHFRKNTTIFFAQSTLCSLAACSLDCCAEILKRNTNIPASALIRVFFPPAQGYLLFRLRVPQQKCAAFRYVLFDSELFWQFSTVSQTAGQNGLQMDPFQEEKKHKKNGKHFSVCSFVLNNS